MLTKLVLATVAIAYLVQVKATMAPSYPEPGTVWKTGQTYKIVWKEDKSEPLIDDEWRDFKIDLMTGDNLQQKFLMNIATGVDGKRQKFYRFQAPEVYPHSPIYFLMFTNDKGDNAWTTRFAITEEGDELIEPENPTQIDGASIPWGVGLLGKKPELLSKVNPAAAMGVQIAAAQPAGVELNAVELDAVEPEAVNPKAIEIEAMKPEKAAEHAEPEVLQAALPGAMPDVSPDLLRDNEYPSSPSPSEKDKALPTENQSNKQTSGVSRLEQPIVGVLLCGLLAKLLFLL